MTTETLRDTIARSLQSASTLAGIAAALAVRVDGTTLDPALAPYVDELVAALGLRETLAQAAALELKPLLAEIRAYTLTNSELLFPERRERGWRHQQPELLVSAGEVSTLFPQLLKRAVAPQLDGLEQRLQQPGAAFLDVGVGVAAMAVEMARLWPSLRVVGIDPWAPSLELARERVRAAGLDTRIELREQAGEALPDENAFDLAWVPSPFVAESALPRVIERVHRALRPGGFLLLPMLRPGGDAVSAALIRLRTALFGGRVTTPEVFEALLREHGFADVRSLPSAPGAVSSMIVGQKRA